MEVLQVIGLLGGIALAVATVISVLLAVWSSRRNAESQVQLLALNSLQHYLDLAVTYPDLAGRGDDQPVDARYGWFAAQALVTAQTLWTLVGNRVEWQRSVNAIIRHHRSYLRSGAFVCDDFSPEFVRYVRERVPDIRCADVRDGAGGPVQPDALGVGR